eukprot:symbB.v1.2.016613.t1/scaffold1200.1/size132039/3
MEMSVAYMEKHWQEVVEARQATTTGELQRLAEGQTELWATLDQVRQDMSTLQQQSGSGPNLHIEELRAQLAAHELREGEISRKFAREEVVAQQWQNAAHEHKQKLNEAAVLSPCYLLMEVLRHIFQRRLLQALKKLQTTSEVLKLHQSYAKQLQSLRAFEAAEARLARQVQEESESAVMRQEMEVHALQHELLEERKFKAEMHRAMHDMQRRTHLELQEHQQQQAILQQ